MKPVKYLMPVAAIAIFVWAGCKQLYLPPETSINNSYLVIEGFIAGGADSTFIKISRTVKLSQLANKAEGRATVTVEDDQNNTYVLKELADAGRYGIPAIGLDDNRKYRLRVKTTDNQTYLSDYVPVRNSAPIDSVGFKITDAGLTIYTNTHDATNKTHYYRWEYEETWKFHVTYDSGYLLNGVVRKPNEHVFYCFGSHNSNNVVLANTSKLTQDVVYQAPMATIPYNSEKLQLRYSILVRQYAVTEEAYSFWNLLKTNTESLGSIFDAQPSQLIGNIKCTSKPDLPVVGYIGAGKIQTKRIFIDNLQLPQSWVVADAYHCGLDTIPGEVLITTGPPRQWTSRACGDCTTRGKTAQPAFWK
jgi:hypothetical protein